MGAKNRSSLILLLRDDQRKGEQRSCQASQHLFQEFVFSLPPNSSMKRQVQTGSFQTRRFTTIFHFFELSNQFSLILRRQICSTQKKSFGFQNDSQSVNLLNLFFRQAHDEHPPAGEMNDKTLLL